jgi:hypothetical protein
MHTDKIYFVTYYYSPTCFGRSSNHHQFVIQKCKQCTTVAQNAERNKRKEQQSHFLLLVTILERFELCLKITGFNL